MDNLNHFNQPGLRDAYNILTYLAKRKEEKMAERKDAVHPDDNELNEDEDLELEEEEDEDEDEEDEEEESLDENPE